MISRRRERARQLDELLARRALPELLAWAASTPGALSTLVARLLAPDPLLRWRAIETLGEVCAALARSGELDRVRELVRKQLWSMNDESGNVAWHAPEAIGEILYRVPGLVDPFASNLFRFAREHPFQAGVAWAIARLAERCPELVGDEDRAALAELCAHATAEVRGHAARALGRTGRSEAHAAALRVIVEDPATVQLYDEASGELVERSVGELARSALSSYWDQ